MNNQFTDYILNLLANNQLVEKPGKTYDRKYSFNLGGYQGEIMFFTYKRILNNGAVANTMTSVVLCQN